MTTKGKKRKPDVEFDDDTDDSDDEALEFFRQNVKQSRDTAVGPRKAALTDKADDSEEENEDDSDSDEATDISDDESDREGDNSLVQSNARSNTTALQEKLSKLGSLLKSTSQAEKEKSDRDEMDDDSSEGEDPSDSDEEPTDGSASEANSSDESKDEPVQKKKSPNKSVVLQLLDGKMKQKVSRKSESSGGNILKQAASEDDEEAARLKFRESLAKMSVEQILNLKNSLGLKQFEAKWNGKGGKGAASKKQQQLDFKRENKNRPREMSSKKKASKFKPVVQVGKKEKRDPRFDPLCGEFDAKIFRKSYKFVTEIKEKELGFLRKRCKETLDPEEREKLKYLVKRTENQLRSERQKDEQERGEASAVAGIKEKLEKGEKHIFQSKRVRREEELVKTYKQLKEKGTVDRYIKKKTKANLAKDRKLLDKLIA